MLAIISAKNFVARLPVTLSLRKYCVNIYRYASGELAILCWAVTSLLPTLHGIDREVRLSDFVGIRPMKG
jgi:hypothetical protein